MKPRTVEKKENDIDKVNEPKTIINKTGDML